ncbi:oligosaccharide flippase family protein [Halorussus salinus]|uniref:oligosaccharide flippase family protein n=1 Tax=Halorussus salinus TaxID=1364935 RepID=UPI001092B01D|nr:oligosaccharide flippase family protein [Halorussus salinus]
MAFERSTVLLAASKALSAIITFVGIAFFTRELGSDGIGQFFLFQSVLTFIVFWSNLSIQNAAEKRISEGKPKGEVISSALVLKLFALATTIILVSGISDHINSYLGGDLAYLLVIGIILSGMGDFVIRIMSGDLRIGETAILRLSQRVFWLVTGITLVWYGYGTRAPIIALIIGLFVMFVWATIRCNFEFASPSMLRIRELLSFSKYDLIAGASRKVYNWADVLIIGLFLTSADVGRYEIAWRVTVIAGLLSDSVSQVVFPQISHWTSNNALDKIEQAMSEALAMSMALVIPALFGALILADTILSVVFEIKSPEAVLVLGILMLSRLIFVNFQPMKRILDGLGQVSLSARATAASAIANILLNFVLVQKYGVIGAAVGTTIAVLVGTILTGYYLHLHLEIIYPRKMVVGFLGGSIVMTGVLLGIRRYIDIKSAPVLFATVVLGAIVYVVSLLMYTPTRGFLRRQYESFFVV